MTTNSPNPVDGDVQALIADCQAEIEDLKRSIDRCDAIGTADYLYHLQSQLKRQQVALAALTAEPVAWTSQRSLDIRCKITAFTDVDSATDYGNKIRWESTTALYTAPPAQLLRPVELPDEMEWCEDDDAEDDSYNCGWNNGIKACAKSLRQQGYEVKA